MTPTCPAPELPSEPTRDTSPEPTPDSTADSSPRPTSGLSSELVSAHESAHESAPEPRSVPSPWRVDSVAALEALYASARPASRAKQRRALTPAMRAWLAHAPFLVLSSVTGDGLDCSPRGDAPGEAFRVLDATRIAIPDRRGNNRIDTLRNLVADPRCGLVFLVPGVEETLRVRGRATISIEPALLDAFRLDGEPPASVIVVAIAAVWVQNFRAVRRAALWSEAARVDPAALPDARALAGAEDAAG